MIVLAGEDENDCKILAEVVRAHHPGLGDAKIVRINDPVRLKKKTGGDLESSVRSLVGKAKGKALQQRGRLVAFAVHEDLDGYTDDRYRSVRRTVTAELNRQCPADSAYALAAWESEGWLLLFPDAFPHVRPKWKIPAQLRGKNTGLIDDPKGKLRHTLKSPPFRESDGPLIAQEAAKRGLLTAPVGQNRSHADFLADLGNWSRGS
ncbi:hypothetical protein QIS99_23320 [Streptomyces sp. B-S-A8]|uniref:DUF4276 family protein n=1 Tax=Streptomyces solicavernae TaxID=3043614 RepID=A0ABT6RXD3_9ACTN|nr:hypothetical protein [Streptomyces sp. B-S-A8]MDI3389103.1 hypothetical protein [Streptomyces sp. B-S-A8]